MQVEKIKLSLSDLLSEVSTSTATYSLDKPRAFACGAKFNSCIIDLVAPRLEQTSLSTVANPLVNAFLENYASTEAILPYFNLDLAALIFYGSDLSGEFISALLISLYNIFTAELMDQAITYSWLDLIFSSPITDEKIRPFLIDYELEQILFLIRYSTHALLDCYTGALTSHATPELYDFSDLEKWAALFQKYDVNDINGLTLRVPTLSNILNWVSLCISTNFITAVSVFEKGMEDIHILDQLVLAFKRSTKDAADLLGVLSEMKKKTSDIVAIPDYSVTKVKL